ncbi:hypothetical protein [Subdoligranulum variabile]|uniref:Phage head-tail adaptor n=1 Tax=Subdoligranulum variabile DSM 15176 TaxID=411471 RepID=D1PND3_9FIRM|nr:hypothetical protein [Subdoligranulum variabile]EFB76068.1 putative phage head-tail adaptor [Subdoligranulum variabile DSM 15176]UWP68717.1 hypothetical protein NQ490_02390 [Subdoligranulum variabile]
MDRSNVLTLVDVSYITDALNQQVPQETTRDVFCNISSVSAQEFFDAGQAGLNPEWRVTMFAPDYNGETIAVLNGTRYGVYRTYLGKNETIELYLERKAGI